MTLSELMVPIFHILSTKIAGFAKKYRRTIYIPLFMTSKSSETFKSFQVFWEEGQSYIVSPYSNRILVSQPRRRINIFKKATKQHPNFQYISRSYNLKFFQWEFKVCCSEKKRKPSVSKKILNSFSTSTSWKRFPIGEHTFRYSRWALFHPKII